MTNNNYLQELVEKRLKKQLKKFLNFHEKKIKEEKLDPETIHEFRVRIRKIRSILEEFVNEIRFDISIIESLRKVFRKAGRVRDYDVLIGHWIELRNEYHETKKKENENSKKYKEILDFLKDWEKHIEKKREKKFEEFNEYLNSDKFEDLLKEIEKLKENLSFKNFYLSDMKTNSIANLVLSKFFKLFSHSYFYVEHDDIYEIHHFRRQVKRTRYFLEFFKKFYKKSQYKDIIEKLKELQDTTGLLVDYYVLEKELEKFENQFIKQNDLILETQKIYGMIESKKDELLKKLYKLKKEFLELQEDYVSIIKNECNLENIKVKEIE
ncbi:MAG: CHAD domain-containing protein [Leptospiraceae bacterium]|nr:CHAD domain-containing protein [Leptospiraceae bacterium]MDW7975825.1 CHAD domain-containing protein [Leptospiraceae bacterium]